MAAALMVSDAVPLEVSFTVCVDGVLRLTLPKATLVEPSVNAAVPVDAGFSCRAYVSELLLSDAVRVAVCAAVTAEAVAVKAALVAPEAIVTDAGSFTALMLLVRLTVVALLAVCNRVTVQASVPGPVHDPTVQVSALSCCPWELDPWLLR